MKITHFCLLIAFGSFAQVRGQQPVVGVPFEFVRNEIIVQVKVDGKGPFNMMLDTGTDPSAVDLATAKEWGLKLSSVGGPVSGGGTDKNVAYATRLPLVEVGGLTVKNVVFFGKGTGRDKKPWGVNIGNVFFKDFVVTIDYRSKLVTLERP